MNRTWIAFLLALALGVQPLLVTAQSGSNDAEDENGNETDDSPGSDRGSSERGRSQDRNGGPSDEPGDGDEDSDNGGDADEDDGPGRELGALHRDQAQRRRNFTEEQREERRDFEEAQRVAREGCRDENLTEEQRDACEDALRGAHEEFNETERDERKAFEEGLRDEFEAEKDQRLDRHEKRVGHFNVSDGGVAGRWVTFRVDTANATLSDLTVAGRQLLDAVTILGAGELEEMQIEGAEFELEFENGELKLHDNPALAMRVETKEGASGSLDIADYLVVTRENDTFRITDGGNFSATLRARENVSLGAGNVVSFDDDAKLIVHAPQEILAEVSNRHRDDIEEAKQNDRVGGEFTVLRAEGVVLDAHVLENVTLNFTRDEDSLRFEVGATGLPGKVFVVNVDRSLLRAGTLQLRYFDEVSGVFVEVPVVAAQGGIADCLDATDDSTPEYCVVKGDDGWQVIVTVNSWSVHAFTISSVPFLVQAPPPTAILGIFAAIGVAAIASAGLFRRKK